MKKLTFDRISIELTRDCNMQPPCPHCFRGDARKEDIKKEYIDALLEQTEIIGTLFFTGGEPTMKLDIMQYILDQLYARRIPLFEFGFITNGMKYDYKIVSLIKRYAELVKLCVETGTGKSVDITRHIVIGISIDKFHAHRSVAENNMKLYKKALKGYAQVVKVADGNLTIKEGRAESFKEGICNLNLEDALMKRVEILDADHKPLCPQYETYRLVKPEQVMICCDMYLSCYGKLLLQTLGTHRWEVVDAATICDVTTDDIYKSIIAYNETRLDCISIMKNRVEKISKHMSTQDILDSLFYIAHKKEDDSDVIQPPEVNGRVNMDNLVMSASAKKDTSIFDTIKRGAMQKDYFT